MQRALSIFAAAILATGCIAADPGPVLMPWQADGATHRQVVEVRSEVERPDTVATFAVAAPADRPLRVVDAAEPATALPVFRDGHSVSVQLPGLLAGSRRLAVYWSDKGQLPVSAVLAAKPVAGDDYATAVRGDAWDFNEGDQDGIRSWGDRPSHYGEITVKDGLLNIPVTGKDPYCIWGVMFGNPADQPDASCETIDSGRYTRLRLRVRQSCNQATWGFFFTDEKGRYQSHSFVVGGREFQILEFDLPKVLPGFWDGRTMRSFRLDTTNDRPGTTVQIDWIRLESPAPTAAVGPVFTRGAVMAREATRGFGLEAPRVATAGDTGLFRVVNPVQKDLAGLLDGVRFSCALRTMDGELVDMAAGVGGGLKHAPVDLSPNVGQTARQLRWVVGVQDDLGAPAPPTKNGELTVQPAALDHYVLTPSRQFVPVTGDRLVRVSVAGADSFGNPVPVRTHAPRLAIVGGGRAELEVKNGVVRDVRVTCADVPLTTHRLTFSDENGIKGECTMQTIGFREDRVAVSSTGYMTVGGELFLPLGGFYANWPSGLPAPDGKIARSLDLFPCGPKPYTYGYPWTEEVEQKVVTYLDLCQAHGVTALRLMLRNMDIVGRVDPVQLKATLHLFDLARERGIRFNVALFEDYTKPPYVTRDIIEQICLPHYAPEELAALPPHRARFLVDKRVVDSTAARYLDPDAIQCQKDYLDELIPVLAGREEVICYEFENEMVRPPMSWCREIAAYMRTIDPRTPVLGNPGPHEWPEPWRWRDSTVDLFSYHPYNNGREDADHGAVMFMRSKWAAASGIPFYTGEGGINQNRWRPEIQKVPNDTSMRGARDQIWLSMACGATGAFLWTADCDAEMAEFGKVQPALKAVGIDLLALKRRTPRVVITMPDDNSANGNAHGLAYQLLSLGVDFDTRPATEARGYAVKIDSAAKALPEDLAPEFFAPSEGWQLASLVSQDGEQALIYLRNVAGGIQNQGGDKPCWVRSPAPAPAVIGLVGGDWQQARAYDLDTGRNTPLTHEGARLVLPGPQNHDMVIGLVRRKGN